MTAPALLLQGCGGGGRSVDIQPLPNKTTETTTTTSQTSYASQRVGSFLALGDWGWDKDIHGEIDSVACQQAIADAMADSARALGDVKFVINVGDSFYPGGVANKSDPAWDVKWRNIYAEELRAVPWYSVYGNHDIHVDPCACADDVAECAQVNANTSDLSYFYMPNTSYFVEHEDIGLEVVALDMNYYTWVNYTCPWTPCEEKCRTNLKARMDAAFELFYQRTAASQASSLVVFSHYPTDYFWGFPKFLDALRNESRTHIEYFGGHRHNVDQNSTTSTAPQSNWVVGGGGGWGCEGYAEEQGFVVGEILANGTVATYPVLVDFSICCTPHEKEPSKTPPAKEDAHHR